MNTEIEKNIIWIGNRNSHGVINPKLQFNFSSRAGARFMAAICNDGWISDGVYYSNKDPALRQSVIRDTLQIFGGNEKTVREWIKIKDQYLSFPSIIRDTMLIHTKFKGIKSENNPSIPSFISKDTELICGWIEQTIADEGCVKYYPKEYRREIIWTRSIDSRIKEFKLHEEEKRFLKKLGIVFTVYIMGRYNTIRNIPKVRLGIRISRKENLLKLRKLITIPGSKKNELLSLMNEPLDTKRI